MKNVLVVVVLAVVAFFAYQYFDTRQVAEVSARGTDNTAETAFVNTPNSGSLTSTAPENASVFIIEPGNGTIVASPITIKFGITNMQVAAAGTNIENTGHHHLLLDLDVLPSFLEALPASSNVIHFGKGQTETTIELSPGTHSLQLLLGNYLHIPHSPPVISKKIYITVE